MTVTRWRYKGRPQTPKPGLTPGNPVAREVLEHLREIDTARDVMRRHEDNLFSLQVRSKRVSQAWWLFQAAGGVDAEDWGRFLRGQPLRGCTRKRKHLRVVIDNSRRNAGRRS